MELGEIGNFPGEGEYIYKHSKFCDGVYSVDLVDRNPLVRCRDCKFSMFDKECSRVDPWVDETWFAIEPNGFCAWGERRRVWTI